MIRALRRLWLALTRPPQVVLPPPDRSVKREGQIRAELSMRTFKNLREG